jgi:hypothetical protein
MNTNFTTLLQFQPMEDKGNHVKLLTRNQQGLTVDMWQMDAEKPYYQAVAYIPGPDGNDDLDILLGREDTYKFPLPEDRLASIAQNYLSVLRKAVVHGAMEQLHYKMTDADLVKAQAAMKPLNSIVDNQYINNDNIEIGGKEIHWRISSIFLDSMGRATPGFLQKITFTVVDGNVERSVTIKHDMTENPKIDVGVVFETNKSLITEVLGLDLTK